MKRISVMIIIVLVLIACSNTSAGGSVISQLTPYITESGVTETPQDADEEIAATAIPVATPTPIVHIVALGETISSIALQYGISIDAILAANPGISPNAMIVGDEVIVPAVSAETSPVIDTTVINAIKLADPYCVPSGGGLWCSVMVSNSSEIVITDAVITFNFKDSSGNSILSKNAPTILRKLLPEPSLPGTIFLADAPVDHQTLEVALLSAQSSAQSDEVIEVIEEDRQVTLEPLRADITGVMQIPANEGSDKADLTIAAAALNSRGQVIGVRRKDITVAVAESFDFNITVYSSGEEIADVILYTEVN